MEDLDDQLVEVVDQINAAILKLSNRLGTTATCEVEQKPTLWGGVNFIFEEIKENTEWPESPFYQVHKKCYRYRKGASDSDAKSKPVLARVIEFKVHT